jgi:hypothetical protein
MQLAMLTLRSPTRIIHPPHIEEHHVHMTHFFSGNRRARRVAITTGAVLATGVAAFAATNWVVGLTASSSGQGQSASISNLTIAAVATPTIGAGNTLYPSSVGDVVVKITNPNQFPVTVTGVNLPTATTYAPGYSDSLLSSAQTGCDSTLSFVSWTFASGTSGSVHTVSPIVVAGLGTSTVTLTGDASMGANSALACANTYFKMPALTGVVATSAPQGTVATTSPSVNGWTS